MTAGTCGVVGEKAQVIPVLMRASGDGNTSYRQRLGVMMVKPLAIRSLWRPDSKMLKNTSIEGVS